MGDLRKVGALWKREGKNGTYYSGDLNADAVKSALVGGETHLLLFPVKNKRDRGPAVELFCAVPSARAEKPRDDGDDF